MYELGLTDRPFENVLGSLEMLGKYHPHGDQAVYDALVRLVQVFDKISILMVVNFGSVDNDPPAAMVETSTWLMKVS